MLGGVMAVWFQEKKERWTSLGILWKHLGGIPND
jgi:hypothetical protein